MTVFLGLPIRKKKQRKKKTSSYCIFLQIITFWSSHRRVCMLWIELFRAPKVNPNWIDPKFEWRMHKSFSMVQIKRMKFLPKFIYEEMSYDSTYW